MNGTRSRVRAVVLAAGKGTRMKSARPKVLHAVCGRPMLWHVLRALRDAGVAETIVVTNEALDPHVDAIARAAGHGGVRTVIQTRQRGTGDAVRTALEVLETASGTILVLNGDMPLVDEELLRRTVDARDGALALVTARMPLPSAFGRIVRRGEAVERIVEARDAAPDELAIEEMNAGLYAYDEASLRDAVRELRCENAQGEYYLTDTVAGLVRAGAIVRPVVAHAARIVHGVNDRSDLALAEFYMRQALCERHMRAGVTIVDPATTYFEPDCVIGTDVVIRPNCTIGAESVIGEHAEIGPNVRLVRATLGAHVVASDCVVADSTIGDFAVIGPYAHVREGCVIGTGVRIGNFVETKNARLAPGVKAGHLSYLGDAEIGERTNVGAGTITCNYDGKTKHRTRIGADAFIGSNSSLVAPLDIGNGALTGAGAVVTRDVAAGARVVGNPARPLPLPAPSD